MQGYILHLQRVKEEDIIVTILTRERLESLYRFYGCRHSVINLGFKIDFEIERMRSSMGRLKDVYHLAYPWLLTSERLRLWQQFLALFHPHLREAETLDPDYFTLLDAAADAWNVQNPKRVAVESYLHLLTFEGRLHHFESCFFCNTPVKDDPTFIRAMHPAHAACSGRRPVNRKGALELFETGSTLFLEDEEVDRLWQVLMEGL